MRIGFTIVRVVSQFQACLSFVPGGLSCRLEQAEKTLSMKRRNRYIYAQSCLVLPYPDHFRKCNDDLWLASFDLLSALLTLLHVSKSGITLATTVLGHHGSQKRISAHTLEILLITLKSVCWCVELGPVDLFSC